MAGSREQLARSVILNYLEDLWSSAVIPPIWNEGKPVITSETNEPKDLNFQNDIRDLLNLIEGLRKNRDSHLDEIEYVMIKSFFEDRKHFIQFLKKQNEKEVLIHLLDAVALVHLLEDSEKTVEINMQGEEGKEEKREYIETQKKTTREKKEIEKKLNEEKRESKTAIAEKKLLTNQESKIQLSQPTPEVSNTLQAKHQRKIILASKSTAEERVTARQYLEEELEKVKLKTSRSPKENLMNSDLAILINCQLAQIPFDESLLTKVTSRVLQNPLPRPFPLDHSESNSIPSDYAELLAFTEEELIATLGKENAEKALKGILYWEAYERYTVRKQASLFLLTFGETIPSLIIPLLQLTFGYLTNTNIPSKKINKVGREGVIARIQSPKPMRVGTDQEIIADLIADFELEDKELEMQRLNREKLKIKIKEQLKNDLPPYKFEGNLPPDQSTFSFTLDEGIIYYTYIIDVRSPRGFSTRYENTTLSDFTQINAYAELYDRLQNHLTAQWAELSAPLMIDLNLLNAPKYGFFEVPMDSEFVVNFIRFGKWLPVICELAEKGHEDFITFLNSNYTSLREIYPPDILRINRDQIVNLQAVNKIINLLYRIDFFAREENADEEGTWEHAGVTYSTGTSFWHAKDSKARWKAVREFKNEIGKISEPIFSRLLTIISDNDFLRKWLSEHVKPILIQLFERDSSSTKNLLITQRFSQLFALREKKKDEIPSLWKPSKSKHLKYFERLLKKRNHPESSHTEEKKLHRKF